MSSVPVSMMANVQNVTLNAVKVGEAGSYFITVRATVVPLFSSNSPLTVTFQITRAQNTVTAALPMVPDSGSNTAYVGYTALNLTPGETIAATVIAVENLQVTTKETVLQNVP